MYICATLSDNPSRKIELSTPFPSPPMSKLYGKQPQQSYLSVYNFYTMVNVRNVRTDRDYHVIIFVYTLQPKSQIGIPRKGIAKHQSQFPHSRDCEQFIYSQDWSTYFPAAEKADRLWEYMNPSQTHECGNWD